MEEKTFYSNKGVTVTNSRFIVEGQTYAMSGVTSVKAGKLESSQTGPIVVAIVGALLLCLAEFRYVALGILVIALAGFWGSRRKPTYCILLCTSSGEARALSSQDHGFIASVVAALNDAIIHRG